MLQSMQLVLIGLDGFLSKINKDIKLDGLRMEKWIWEGLREEEEEYD